MVSKKGIIMEGGAMRGMFTAGVIDVLMENNIDFDAIARATSGASGAELANIVNEAALRAVRMGRNRVAQSDLMESVEVILAGYERKGAVISKEEKEIIGKHYDMTDFKVGLTLYGKLRPVRIEGGVVLMDTPYKMREIL